MNVLSLFDGMSCGRIALERAGIPVTNYFASEIDKYAIKVSKANWPDIVQIGDVQKVTAKDLPKIDLLIGGSPCQGFSFAGKGLNFEDPRSKLFFEYVRLLNECMPRYFLLENVKMKKEHQDVISEYLKCEPIEINSNLISAQNRKRLYWTNILNIYTPKDLNITWGDVREKGVESEKYYYTEMAMQWLARHSQSKNKKLSVHSDNEKMQMLEASHHKKYSSQRFFGIVDLPNNSQKVTAMRGRYLVLNSKKTIAQYIEFRHDGKTNALTTVAKDNIVVPFTLPNKISIDEFFFRYITPLECERLQNVPDNYTNHVSDSQRYKMLGNGWTVDVIAHMLKNID